MLKSLVRRKKWQPTPIFLPGKSYGQRSLTGYRPWDGKESDTTERLTQTHTQSLVGFPGGAVVKNPPTNAGDVDLIPGSGRSQEEMAARSNVLACEIPFTAEPGGLQSMESQKSWT